MIDFGAKPNLNERRIYDRHPPDGLTDDPKTDFGNSPTAKIFNGDIIMPDGEFWHISHGRRLPHQALFVFTSETMPNGEVRIGQLVLLTNNHSSESGSCNRFSDVVKTVQFIFTEQMVVALFITLMAQGLLQDF